MIVPVAPLSERTPVEFKVTLPVKAPPPDSPVPAITCVDDAKKKLDDAILSLAKVPTQTGVNVWVLPDEVMRR